MAESEVDDFNILTERDKDSKPDALSVLADAARDAVAHPGRYRC